jgi:hypothetical protein
MNPFPLVQRLATSGAAALSPAKVFPIVLNGAKPSTSAMFRRFSAASQRREDANEPPHTDGKRPGPQPPPSQRDAPWLRRGDEPFPLDRESMEASIFRAGETLKWNLTAQISCEVQISQVPAVRAAPQVQGLPAESARLHTLQQMRPDLVSSSYVLAGHEPQYHPSREQFVAMAERNPIVETLARTASFQGRHVYPDAFNTAWSLMKPQDEPFEPTFLQNAADVMIGKPYGFESRQLNRDEILTAISEKGGAVVVGTGELTAADSRRRWSNAGVEVPPPQPGAWNLSKGRQANALIVVGHAGALSDPNLLICFDQDSCRQIYQNPNLKPSTNPFMVHDELTSQRVPYEMAHHMFRVVHVDGLVRETAPSGTRPMLLVPSTPFCPPQPRTGRSIGP